MYNFGLVLLCAVLLAFALARPTQDQSADTVTTTATPATIIKQVDVNNPDGSFNSSYETSNGIRVENVGYMKKILIPRTETEDGQVIEDHEELILVQSGSYSYLDPEGNIITLTYLADENGFQPEGDHLPQLVQLNSI